MKICPKCQQENASDRKWCSNCLANMSDTPEARTAYEIRVCPNCQQEKVCG